MAFLIFFKAQNLLDILNNRSNGTSDLFNIFTTRRHLFFIFLFVFHQKKQIILNMLFVRNTCVIHPRVVMAKINIAIELCYHTCAYTSIKMNICSQKQNKQRTTKYTDPISQTYVYIRVHRNLFRIIPSPLLTLLCLLFVSLSQL